MQSTNMDCTNASRVDGAFYPMQRLQPVTTIKLVNKKAPEALKNTEYSYHLTDGWLNTPPSVKQVPDLHGRVRTRDPGLVSAWGGRSMLTALRGNVNWAEPCPISQDPMLFGNSVR
jgi:hypothetical protein